MTAYGEPAGDSARRDAVLRAHSFELLGHRPRLDGLRGIAVLTVVVGHTVPAFPGAGAVGVGLFFVLSGFLITRLLLEELTTFGRLDYPRFYLRRAFRLYPALVCVVAVFAVTQLAGMWRHGHEAFGIEALVALLYLTDALPLVAPRRFGALSFTWTLAIEEQFYLLWPFVLAMAHRRLGGDLNRLARLLGVGIFVASFGRLVAWQFASIHFTPVQWADSLLAGCLLAVVTFAGILPTRQLSRWAFAAAALPYVFLVFRAFNYFDHVVTASFLVAGNATFVYMALSPCRSRIDLLGSTLLVWIGRLSYSLYLWHSLLNEYAAGRGMDTVPRAALVWVGGFVLAWLSYTIVEQPFLRRKRRLAHRT